MNVLFLGGGRRVQLANRFIINGFNVYSYENGYIVPISQVAYIIKGLPFNDPNIYDDISQNISNYEIDLVVPLMDEAIPICSILQKENKKENVVYLAPKLNPATYCYNKKEFERYMLMYFPSIYPKFDKKEKFICKPQFGFNSNGIKIFDAVDSVEDTDIIKQRFIDGIEYSVDAYFGPNSKMVDCVPRIRLRVAGGEVISTITQMREDLWDWTKMVGEDMKLVGPACFQYIIDKYNQPFLFEINSRFGGGVILSLESGFDIIKLIKRDYFGFEYNYEPKKWINGLRMERFYMETFHLQK